jgi:UDP-N-acetylglucosamine 4-epimerase
MDKNKKVLITGGAGFIGSNLIEYLLDNSEFEIICLDNLSTGFKQNIEEFEFNPRFKFVEGSITDEKLIDELTNTVSLVVHLAALGSVPRSIDNPMASFNHNVIGSCNVFFQALKNKVEKVIYASSSSVYGNDDSKEKLEKNIGIPLSPYALSKLTVEKLASNFAMVYGLKILGVRFFNVFGPKQNPNGAYAAVVPTFISKIFNGENPQIHGTGENSRDFTYVENVCYGILKALKTDFDFDAEVINMSCNRSYSINNLFTQLIEILNSNATAEYVSPRKGDIADSKANLDKAYSLIGYHPIIHFKEGLQKTVSWFKNQY